MRDEGNLAPRERTSSQHVAFPVPLFGGLARREGLKQREIRRDRE